MFTICISVSDFGIKAKQTPFASFARPTPGCIPLTMYFYYVFMCYFSTRTSEVKACETICQSHQDTATLGPGLMYCLCATCNATHTALTLGLICLHFHNFMQTTPTGGGICSPELGHTSAVCVVTLLALKAQISSLEDAVCIVREEPLAPPKCNHLTSIK